MLQYKVSEVWVVSKFRQSGAKNEEGLSKGQMQSWVEKTRLFLASKLLH